MSPSLAASKRPRWRSTASSRLMPCRSISSRITAPIWLLSMDQRSLSRRRPDTSMSSSWKRVSPATSASMSSVRAATDMCSSASRRFLTSSFLFGPKPRSKLAFSSTYLAKHTSSASSGDILVTTE